MPLHLQRELDRLDRQILTVGGLVEKNFAKGVRALLTRDVALANEVIDSDQEVDDLEVEVEEECLKIIALHQPVARDMRYIVTTMKINNDLERIGDLAVNLSKRGILLSNEPGFDLPETFSKMAEAAEGMLKMSLDAMITQTVDKAHQVRLDDDAVDEMNSEIYDYVKEKLSAGTGENVAGLIHLLTAARHLERLADHVTNIAEDVIYMLEGEIVRHKHRERPTD